MTRLTIAALLLSVASGYAAEPDIFAMNKALGRGVNMGNALEAPKEGQWGMTIKDEYFAKIKAAGFDSVRLPVKWSAHCEKTAPYRIEPGFFDRVDHLLDQAEKNKLNVVLNIHHFDELDKTPDATVPQFVALWTQIAERYKDRPSSLYFEMMNEPHDKLTDKKWNEILPKGLAAIRASNPTRPVIVGPASWNAIWILPKLELPKDDRLIVTVHMYNPHEFTHQGADWADARVKAIKNMTWTGTDEQVTTMRKELDIASNWAKKNNRPIYLGEFGAYEKAPHESRVAWTSTVVREAEARGWSWAYWEFGAGFGVYDRAMDEWRTPLLKALIP
jgi:endoglucanase